MDWLVKHTILSQVQQSFYGVTLPKSPAPPPHRSLRFITFARSALLLAVLDVGLLCD